MEAIESPMDKSLEVHVLASGSKGNATVICSDTSAIIVDAGISCRRITKALEALAIPKSQVKGIVITHEHSDHIAGVPQLIKQWGVPILTRPKTAKVLSEKQKLPLTCFEPLDWDETVLGDLVITPFSTSHDAIDPIGITCMHGSVKAALMTDTGIISETMLNHLHDTDLLVLEANYDEQMLKFGPYPPDLKRRVGGQHGHLCNDMAMDALQAMRRPEKMQVVFAHRSEHNNALPIVDLMAHQLQDTLAKRGEMTFTWHHGDPKESVSIGK